MTWLDRCPTAGRRDPSVPHVLPVLLLYLASIRVFIDLTRDSTMPVLEVTQLRLRGVPPDDPTLLHSLSMVRGILNTRSHFYSCIEDPTLLFILSLWPSLQHHQDFLASSRAGDILGPQDAMLEFRWTVHMELDAMTSLPLQAPVMAITRRTLVADDVDAYDEAVAKEKQAVIQSSNHKVASGWRLDASPGTHEALLFTGWEDAQAHITFSARQQENVANVATKGLYEIVEAHHAWDIEKLPI